MKKCFLLIVFLPSFFSLNAQSLDSLFQKWKTLLNEKGTIEILDGAQGSKFEIREWVQDTTQHQTIFSFSKKDEITLVYFFEGFRNPSEKEWRKEEYFIMAIQGVNPLDWTYTVEPNPEENPKQVTVGLLQKIFQHQGLGK